MKKLSERPASVSENVSTRKEFDRPLEKVHGPSENGLSSETKDSAYFNSTCVPAAGDLLMINGKPAISWPKSRVRTGLVLVSVMAEAFDQASIAVFA